MKQPLYLSIFTLYLAVALFLSGCAGNLYQAHTGEYYRSHPSFTHRKLVDCAAAAHLQALAENTHQAQFVTRMDEIVKADPQCSAAEEVFDILRKEGRTPEVTREEIGKAVGEKFLSNPETTRTIALQCYKNAFAVCQIEKVPGVYLYDRMSEIIHQKQECNMAVTAFNFLKSKRKVADFTLQEITGGVQIDRGIGGW